MVAETREGSDPLELDESLLQGFDFACRPDCGLCCFTSPRVNADEEARLRSAAPDVAIVPQNGERCVAARPEGGACQFLKDLRCTVHSVRPALCREFPITVHIGTRLQATVILSCPGVSLDPLQGTSSPPHRRSPPAAFEKELASVRSRIGESAVRRHADAVRRRARVVRLLERQGRWEDEETVRRALQSRSLVPGEDDYIVFDAPDPEEGLERLPMYFDGRAGPVSLGQGLGGWQGLELAPGGGAHPIGVAAPPERRPGMADDARALLDAYLHYFLRRDGFLAAVAFEMTSTEAGTLQESALADLHAIGSTVLVRSAVRLQLSGHPSNRLQRPDIELGIRATDQDWLDRATWGSRL